MGTADYKAPLHDMRFVMYKMLEAHNGMRRMFLNIKAINEGGRAFSTYAAKQLDIAKFSDDANESNKALEPSTNIMI